MKLTLNFPATIEASEVTIEGRRFLLVEAEAFQAIYRTPAAEPVAPKGRVPTVKRAAPAKPVRKVSEKTNGAPANDGSSSLAGEIAALLTKQPLTSAELIEKTKRPPSSVYTILTTMRKDGRIETRDSDQGQRVNALVHRAQSARSAAA